MCARARARACARLRVRMCLCSCMCRALYSADEIRAGPDLARKSRFKFETSARARPTARGTAHAARAAGEWRPARRVAPGLGCKHIQHCIKSHLSVHVCTHARCACAYVCRRMHIHMHARTRTVCTHGTGEDHESSSGGTLSPATSAARAMSSGSGARMTSGSSVRGWRSSSECACRACRLARVCSVFVCVCARARPCEPPGRSARNAGNTLALTRTYEAATREQRVLVSVLCERACVCVCVRARARVGVASPHPTPVPLPRTAFWRVERVA